MSEQIATTLKGEDNHVHLFFPKLGAAPMLFLEWLCRLPISSGVIVIGDDIENNFFIVIFKGTNSQDQNITLAKGAALYINDNS